VLTFQSTKVSLAVRVGAVLPVAVTHVIVGHVTVYVAPPFSMSTTLSPDERESVNVVFADKVFVCILPFAASISVPLNAYTVSVWVA
jgi:hypothetical protein